MKSCYWSAISAGMFAMVGVTANAALVSRLGGLAVYDTDLNITWIADARLSVSNTFGTIGVHPTTGAMDWNTANTWISNMNAANYLGFSDWRLPMTLVPDATCTGNAVGSTGPSGDSTGYNCTGSEMGHLFYTELGATAGTNVTSGDPGELAKFSNISHSLYWSGTVADSSSGLVWAFGFGDGRQIDNAYEGYGNYALVVRSGDVGGASAVPVPAAIWLAGSALIGLAGVAKRKQ